ncbi:hypothetical protein [Anaerostipes sp.]|nr:hypothetical protein [Anaerostipes sp.]MBS7007568.1 hypothetical protein [Anaerostipes sp.]
MEYVVENMKIIAPVMFGSITIGAVMGFICIITGLLIDIFRNVVNKAV